MVSGRTLSHRGEKDTHGLVQSMNAMTHSYTLQVLISNARKLAPKFFLCLQETNGIFGPSVRQHIETNTSQNCVIICTKSSKMSKSTLKYWIKSCLDEVVTCNTLLLQDSWGAQKDESLFEECLTDSTALEIRTIPPEATKYIQPLDVYFSGNTKYLREK